MTTPTPAPTQEICPVMVHWRHHAEDIQGVYQGAHLHSVSSDSTSAHHDEHEPFFESTPLRTRHFLRNCDVCGKKVVWVWRQRGRGQAGQEGSEDSFLQAQPFPASFWNDEVPSVVSFLALIDIWHVGELEVGTDQIPIVHIVGPGLEIREKKTEEENSSADEWSTTSESDSGSDLSASESEK